LETVVLYALLARRVPELNLGRTVIASIKSTLASACMAVVLWLWLGVLGDGNLAAIAAVGAGIGAYFLAAWLLRSEETRYALGMLQARLSRRTG
jgi:hypothetical protein